MQSTSEDRLAEAESYEYQDEDDEHAEPSNGEPSTTRGNGGPPQLPHTRSQYRMQSSEKLKGVANRIIFSRYYIGFYFVMMSLSLTTVVLSLRATHQRQCPPVVWHILEVIVNGLMVIEVTTRWVAYGKKYPMTPLNVIDLLLVLFCSVTLILVFRSPCSEGTRQEEVLDTILLVIRNAVQFLRLGNILRRSGHSLLNPPKPIDLSQARTASLALDLDLDLEDEEAVAERQLAGGSTSNLNGKGRRTLVGGRRGYEPIFQDGDVDEENAVESSGRSSVDRRRSAEQGVRRSKEVRRPLDLRADQGREGLTEEDEDMWDRMG